MENYPLKILPISELRFEENRVLSAHWICNARENKMQKLDFSDEKIFFLDGFFFADFFRFLLLCMMYFSVENQYTNKLTINTVLPHKKCPTLFWIVFRSKLRILGLNLKDNLKNVWNLKYEIVHVENTRF